VLTLTVAPIVALMAAGVLGIYPNSSRTSLVLLPGYALLVGYGLESSARWAHQIGLGFLGRSITASMLAAAALMVGNGTLVQASDSEPLEDYRAAVSYMRSMASSSDLVFVHACCEEGFKLYRRLDPWPAPVTVAVGRTGQPCCPRGTVVAKADEREVRQDVLAHIGKDFRARVFLLSTDRLDYWRYSSIAPEGPMLVSALEEAGCRTVEQNRFVNMRVDVVNCNTPVRSTVGQWTDVRR